MFNKTALLMCVTCWKRSPSLRLKKASAIRYMFCMWQYQTLVLQCPIHNPDSCQHIGKDPPSLCLKKVSTIRDVFWHVPRHYQTLDNVMSNSQPWLKSTVITLATMAKTVWNLNGCSPYPKHYISLNIQLQQIFQMAGFYELVYAYSNHMVAQGTLKTSCSQRENLN